MLLSASAHEYKELFDLFRQTLNFEDSPIADFTRLDSTDLTKLLAHTNTSYYYYVIVRLLILLLSPLHYLNYYKAFDLLIKVVSFPTFTLLIAPRDLYIIICDLRIVISVTYCQQ